MRLLFSLYPNGIKLHSWFTFWLRFTEQPFIFRPQRFLHFNRPSKHMKAYLTPLIMFEEYLRICDYIQIQMMKSKMSLKATSDKDERKELAIHLSGGKVLMESILNYREWQKIHLQCQQQAAE